MKSNKKQIIWSLIFIALIVLTVWVIVKQNESFSIEGFINYVSAAKWLTKGQLYDVDWLPADVMLIDKIKKNI